MQTVNCVVIGDSTVGKTCLVDTYLTNTFKDRPSLPTSVEDHVKEVTVDLKRYKLHISDTGPQDWMLSLRSLLYTKVDVVLICFSLVNRQSFRSVSTRWYPEVRHYCQSVPIILVGTKLEFRTAGLKRILPITYYEGMDLAEEIGAIRYWECSARQEEGVDTVFNDVVRLAVFPRTFLNENGSKLM